MSAKNTVAKTSKAAQNAKTAKTGPPAAKKVTLRKKATETAAPAQKLSALAAAARVLAEAKQPLSCPELIEAMAVQGYWTSPNGKTPGATLAAALQREIVVKKAQSRFK